MINDAGSRLGVAAARRLAALGCCRIDSGLTDAEFDRIEREHGFEFADDHRAFLAAGLPVWQPYEEGQTWEQPWPDWRNADPEALREHLAWPVDCLLWDVQHGHWRQEWGDLPETTQEAVAVARLRLTDVPAMVPVYAHRFLPAGRGTAAHPVLSMRGWDIIYYGTDLLDYIGQEFQEPRPDRADDWNPQATVPFWRDYLRASDE
ncbi:hypothetical protein ACTWLT_02425 [Micromonospora sp. ZYX-F-536]|uniref:hypothetical protein n=1 Tax=Micromonospora sp. ZYX-F-536 TaxID=3457629 RepID=UPI0040408CE1